jgi:ectoine hydroxylase
MLERKEPILWGSKNSAPLSMKQLDRYSNDGFLFFPNFLSENTPNLLQKCIHEAVALQFHDNTESFIFEEDGKHIRTIYNPHGLSNVYKVLIRHPFFVECARQILGSDVYLHQSHLNYKKAFFGKNFFWHQDYTFWHHEDGMPHMRALAVIVFLDEVRADNGPMMMIPESHRWHSERIWDRQEKDPNIAARHNLVDEVERNGLLSPEQVRFLSANKSIFTAMGSVGSVLMYDGNTAHASTDNLSPDDRSIALLFYNSIENTLVNPSRPHYIAERNPIVL